MIRILLSALLIIILSGCARLGDVFERKETQTPSLETERPVLAKGVPYNIELKGLPEDPEEAKRIQDLIEATARSYTLKDQEPASIALLRRRAESDVTALVRVLHSEGYYEGDASVLVDDSVNPAVTRFILNPGPRYLIGAQAYVFEPQIDHLLALQALDAGTVLSQTPARGVQIVESETESLKILTDNGYPYAQLEQRRAEANYDTNILDVHSDIQAGPEVVYGDLEVAGAVQVAVPYIKSFADWERGDLVSKSQILQMQRELVGTRLFDSVRVNLPEDADTLAALDAGGRTDSSTGLSEDLGADSEQNARKIAPILIEVEESKHRTVGGSARYSTADGVGVSAFWEHRNILSYGETLRFDLSVAQRRQQIGVRFQKPRFWRKNQSLNTGMAIFREDTDAYRSLGTRLNLSLTRQLSSSLTASLGGILEISQIDEGKGERLGYLFGLPASLSFDNSDDLLNPTKGVRANWTLTPWGGVYAQKPTGFLVSDMRVAGYLGLDEARDYVLALRGRGAVVAASDIQRVPPNRRLFSGGGGSVRGYRSDFLGRLRAGSPIGGLSVGELAAELRLRYGSFGVVPFIEAGVVGQDAFGDYDPIRLGAGLGLRYYSPIGPIRVDVAVPFDKRQEDDDYQLYFSIGQAF